MGTDDTLAQLLRRADAASELITEIQQTVNRLDFKVSAMQEQIRRMEEQLRDHHNLLFVGNGKESVTSRLLMHKENLERLDQQTKRLDDILERLRNGDEGTIQKRALDVLKAVMLAVVGGAFALVGQYVLRGGAG